MIHSPENTVRNMKRTIRNWIRDNPAAYSVFIRFYLKKRLNLPDANTDCHITGYPRSANTYSHYLAKGLFPNLKFVTHVHTVASLKRAKQLGVPVMLIIRNPKDAVVSMCLKYKCSADDQEAIDGYLLDYIHYHKWILRELPVAEFSSFEEVTERGDAFAFRLARFLKQELTHEDVPKKIAEIKAAVAAREQLKDPDGSSLPQESRRARKGEFLSRVEQSQHLDESLSVYDRVLGRMGPK